MCSIQDMENQCHEKWETKKEWYDAERKIGLKNKEKKKYNQK